MGISLWPPPWLLEKSILRYEMRLCGQGEILSAVSGQGRGDDDGRKGMLKEGRGQEGRSVKMETEEREQEGRDVMRRREEGEGKRKKSNERERKG
jgi:hypothetical protein